MDGQIKDCRIRQRGMKNHQIKRAVVDGITSKRFYRISPPGGGYSEKISLALCSLHHFILGWFTCFMNMIRVVVNN